MAYKLVRAEKNHGIQQSVQVLDPIKNSPLSWLLQIGMRLLGISFYEAAFFAGNLRTRNNENLWLAAQHSSLDQIAFNVAKKTINRSKIVSVLNETWGRNTILLYLAKYYYRVAAYAGHRTVFKILIADALSRNKRNETHHLVLGLPAGYTLDLFEEISAPLNLQTYSLREWSLKKNRLSVLLLIMFIALKRFLNRTVNIFQPKPEFGDVIKPALLLLKEDDLSMDRSYRGQPHWFFKDDAVPAFRTLILETDAISNSDLNRDKFAQFDVYNIPKEGLFFYSEKHTVQKKINSAFNALLYQSLFGSRCYIEIAFQLALLFMRASRLTNLSINNNVKAFMTCENYHRDADAMNLIGPQLGIHILSYQYSNMSEIGPTMMSTADTMCTFSPLFHKRWSNNGIEPKSFVDIGYLFDSSFCLVKKRAEDLRKKLIKNGSQFIISYLDENVHDNDDKYGFMNMNDHLQDISTLAKLVIKDPLTSVIIKTQFRRNSPSIMFNGNKMIESAISTGRFVELLEGKNRNIVFPAEAALASDLVIGHVVGTTAGLETALAGRRCILINNNNISGANIEIFKEADILYSNIDLALNAISLFCQGKPEYQSLGDWSPITNLFDSSQDGQSAYKMRKILDDRLLRV